MGMFVVYVLTGIALVVGASVGVVFLLARAVASANAHDQKTCDCWDCRDRRARSVAKLHEARAKEENQAPWLKSKRQADAMKTWMCTEELQVNDRVQGAVPDKVYRVADLRGSEHGVVVSLVNVATGRRSIVTVAMDRLQKRMWKKAGRA